MPPYTTTNALTEQARQPDFDGFLELIDITSLETRQQAIQLAQSYSIAPSVLSRRTRSRCVG